MNHPSFTQAPVSDVDQVSILFQKMGYPSRFFFYFSSTFIPLFPSIFPIFSRGDYTHIFFRYDNTLLAYTYYNVRGWWAMLSVWMVSVQMVNSVSGTKRQNVSDKGAHFMKFGCFWQNFINLNYDKPNKKINILFVCGRKNLRISKIPLTCFRHNSDKAVEWK